MFGWLRSLFRRYPSPEKAVEREVPIARELPQTIAEAERVRRSAEQRIRLHAPMVPSQPQDAKTRRELDLAAAMFPRHRRRRPVANPKARLS